MKNKPYWVEGDFDQTDIGEIIKAIRSEHLDMSQEDFAQALDIKVDNLKKCENGKSLQSPAILKTMINKFDLKATIKVSSK